MKHFEETGMVFGHRGVAGHAPENTLAFFDIARRRGVDAIELDVRQALHRFCQWPFEAFQVPVRHQGIPVVDRAFVKAAHAVGKVVHCWTMNRRTELRDLWALGVDGIMSDYPDLALATQAAYSQRPWYAA